MTIIEYKKAADPLVEASRPNQHEKAIARQKKHEDPKTIEDAEAIFHKNGKVDDGNLGGFATTIVKHDDLSVVSNKEEK